MAALYAAGGMFTPHLVDFACTRCDAATSAGAAVGPCAACGGNLVARYAHEAIADRHDPAAIAAAGDRSVWHYGPLLPLAPPPGSAEVPTPLGTIGWSPLYRAPRLEADLGQRQIWLKDDGRLPSASFKDRASAMVVAWALATGTSTLAVASTGNAASALATMAAGTRVEAVIFVPAATPEAKLAMCLAHGARVFAVQGSYDDAVRLCGEACSAFGWVNRSTGINPWTREGKQTAGFEIAEQLGRARGVPFAAPDVVVVPVGDGNILAGVHQGFARLAALRWIERVPRFIGVTARRAPSLARAWASGGEELAPVPSTTIASGISVDLPLDGVTALRAIRATGGSVVEAGDREMLAALATLAATSGVFVEPACAAALVGLEKARASGVVDGGEEVVLQLTGSGLKDTAAALRAAGVATPVRGLRDVAAALGS